MDKDDFVEITDLTPAERLSKALERRKAQQFEASNPLLSAEVQRQDVVPQSAEPDPADATVDGTTASPPAEFIPRKVNSPFADEARIPLWRHRLPFIGNHPAAKLLERLALRVYGQPGGSPADVLRRKRRIEMSIAVGTAAAIFIPLAAIVSQINSVEQRSREVESRAIDRITDDLIVTELGPQNANIVGAPPAAANLAPSAVPAADPDVDYPEEYLPLVRSAGGVDQRRSERAQAVADMQSEQEEYRTLREAVAAAPNDMRARLALARWLFSRGWLQEAIQQFKILEAAKMLDGEDRINYARALIRMAQPRTAEELLTSIVMRNKGELRARLILMGLYQSQGESGAVKQLADEGLSLAKSEADKAAINNFLLSPSANHLADDIPARQAPLPATDDTKVGG